MCWFEITIYNGNTALGAFGTTLWTGISTLKLVSHQHPSPLFPYIIHDRAHEEAAFAIWPRLCSRSPGLVGDQYHPSVGINLAVEPSCVSHLVSWNFPYPVSSLSYSTNYRMFRRTIGLVSAFPLAGLYTFMKWVTYWPQAWLGTCTSCQKWSHICMHANERCQG